MDWFLCDSDLRHEGVYVTYPFLTSGFYSSALKKFSILTEMIIDIKKSAVIFLLKIFLSFVLDTEARLKVQS